MTLAHHHFSDPEWNGAPLEPDSPKQPKPTGGCIDEPPPPSPGPAPEPRREKIKVILADGKARNIQHMTATTFWSTDCRSMPAAQFLENLFGALPDFFKDKDQLRAIWRARGTRKVPLAGLAEKGFG